MPYIYCALYFYYISSTSDHQALDPGGGGHLPLRTHQWVTEVWDVGCLSVLWSQIWATHSGYIPYSSPLKEVGREHHSDQNLGGSEEVSHGSLRGKAGKCIGNEPLESINRFIKLLSPVRTTWSSSKSHRSCSARLCLWWPVWTCVRSPGHNDGDIFDFICHSFKVRKIYYFLFSTQNMGSLIVCVLSCVWLLANPRL